MIFDFLHYFRPSLTSAPLQHLGSQLTYRNITERITELHLGQPVRTLRTRVAIRVANLSLTKGRSRVAHDNSIRVLKEMEGLLVP